MKRRKFIGTIAGVLAALIAIPESLFAKKKKPWGQRALEDSSDRLNRVRMARVKLIDGDMESSNPEGDTWEIEPGVYSTPYTRMNEKDIVEHGPVGKVEHIRDMKSFEAKFGVSTIKKYDNFEVSLVPAECVPENQRIWMVKEAKE